MIRYILKRILWLIPIVIGVSLIILIIISLTPGFPKVNIQSTTGTFGKIDAFLVHTGIINSLLGKCLRFISHALLGDLGQSLTTGNNVTTDIAMRFPYTLFIVTCSVLLAILIGVPLGIYSATHHRSWKDRLSVTSTLFFVSMPDFWFALMLVSIISVKLRWLPALGIDSWKGWILPILSLSLGNTAAIARQTRSSMLEQLSQGYVLTALAKGQSTRIIIYRHVLKNAMIPIILTVGTIFGLSLSGVFIMEQIFSLPGLGVYTIASIFNRDYPALQGITFFISVAYSIVILIIDIAFALVNPHIRSQYSKKRR